MMLHDALIIARHELKQATAADLRLALDVLEYEGCEDKAKAIRDELHMRARS